MLPPPFRHAFAIFFFFFFFATRFAIARAPRHARQCARPEMLRARCASDGGMERSLFMPEVTPPMIATIARCCARLLYDADDGAMLSMDLMPRGYRGLSGAMAYTRRVAARLCAHAMLQMFVE